MTQKQIEDEIKAKAQKARKLARYMSSTQDLVEGQIEKAMKKGDFNNLEGMGKPLNLYDNPYEPVEMRMMFKILKNNDFAPYWIQLGREIDTELKEFDKEVELFKKYISSFLNSKHASGSIRRFEKKKANFYYESRLKLDKISKKIIDYNLHCPTFREGRANIDIDDKMFEVINEIEKLIEECKK